MDAQTVINMLVGALTDDETCGKALADVLREAGWETAALRLERMLMIRSKLHGLREQKAKDLEEVQEEQGDYGPRDQSESEDVAYLEGQIELLDYLQSNNRTSLT